MKTALFLGLSVLVQLALIIVSIMYDRHRGDIDAIDGGLVYLLAAVAVLLAFVAGVEA